MKNVLYILAACLVSNLMSAQTLTKNYIKNTTPQVEVQTEAALNALSADDKIETINYFDGLGRPLQSIAKQAGGQKQDIITPFVYDNFGYQVQDYLPYARTYSNGQDALRFESPEELMTNLNQYYLNKYSKDLDPNAPNPYSEKVLEDSPLRRVWEQAAPGKDWTLDSGHTIKFDYQTNTNADKVKHFSVSFPSGNTEVPQLVSQGLYQPNELYKTITKDENWTEGQHYAKDHTTEEYKNNLGRIILKRTFNQDQWHDTYYVYDHYGNLTYVLPPKMATYADFWQTDIPSQTHSINNDFGFYQAGHQSTSNSGRIKFNSYNKTLRLNLQDSYYASYYNPSPTPVNINFVEGKVMDLNLGVDFPELQLSGNITYLDENKVPHYQAITGRIFGNELFLDAGYPNVPLGFYMYLSADLDGVDLTVPDMTSDDLDALAYQYRYDYRNRLVEKKIPGKGWEYIVYDQLDRPVLTQDANLRASGHWLFTKYDTFCRVVYTGIISSSDDRISMQSLMNVQTTINESRTENSMALGGGTLFYTNEVFPEDNILEVHTINYYDDYNFGVPSELSLDTDVFGTSSTADTKTLSTGNQVRVLGNTGQIDWITTVTYYDDKARPVYVASKNDYLNTQDIVKSQLDFTGKVLKTESSHTKGSNAAIVVRDNFTYDHAGRLLTQTQTINDSEAELIANNHYDGLGQLVRKNVGGQVAAVPETSVGLQTVDYVYNIRGWLSKINNPEQLEHDGDLFGFGINYNDPRGPTSSTWYNNPLYNGNISHVYWKTDNMDSGIWHYSYKYDALNRFTHAYFAENHRYSHKYNSYVYGYDRNGNIERLYRGMVNPSNPDGSVGMDNLTYTYNSGNQLLEVKDNYGLSTTGQEGFRDGNTTGNDYLYDTNGNMTEDKNKGITSMTYNHLNLPTQILFSSGGPMGNSEIRYVYDATGVKLAKEVMNREGFYETKTTTQYAGNYIYERLPYDNTCNFPGAEPCPPWNFELRFLSHPEGYVEPNGTNGFDYVYQYKDHLGNIRLSYKDSNNDNQIMGATTEIFYEDFEMASGWDSEGALAGTVLEYGGEHVMSGNYAGKLTTTVNTGIYAHSNTWISIDNEQPTDYIFSGWVYSDNPGARFLLFMNEDTETGYYTEISVTDLVTLEYQWVYLEQRVTVPAHIDKINFRVDNCYYGAGTVWFDDLSIRRVNNVADIEIVEENNYYPFGLKHEGYNDVVSANVNSVASKFRFGGKELSEELGLDTYDFGARNYSPELGRWFNIDPLADYMESESPYDYAFNNPIYYRDMDGRAPKGMLDPYLIFNGKDNKLYIYDDNDTPDDKSDDILLGTFDAHNNVASTGNQGKWEDGTYEMYDKNTRRTRTSMESVNLPFRFYLLTLSASDRSSRTHRWARGMSRISTRVKQDSDYGRYGRGGIYRAVNFTQSDFKYREGMGVHSGRLHKSFYSRVTNGCIRTTDEAMAAIDDAIKKYGPLTSITIEDNLAPIDRPKNLQPLDIVPTPVIPIPVPSPVVPDLSPVPVPNPSPAPLPIKLPNPCIDC